MSLYVRTSQDQAPPDPNGLIFLDKTPKYIHTHISSLTDLDALLDIVRQAYNGASGM